MKSNVQRTLEPFLSAFKIIDEQAAVTEPAWFYFMRKKALEAFAKMKAPTVRDELWRYTNLVPLFEQVFLPAKGIGVSTLDLGIIRHKLRAKMNWPRLVFVNGMLYDALSSVEFLPDGVNISGLRHFLMTEEAENVWHGSDSSTKDFFRHMNEALLNDGSFIHFKKDVVLEHPLYLLFVSVSEKEQHMAHTRNVIQLDSGSRATIVEEYIYFSKDNVLSYFNNVINKIQVGAGAALTHIKLQCESEAAYHLDATDVAVSENGKYARISVDVGAKLARNGLRVNLDEEGGSCHLNGLYYPKGQQHMDNTVWVEHKAPNGSSNQLFKGLLDGRSSGVFFGKVLVHQDAQKTDAHQINKNLLLSSEASADTRPQLEILADDVKCTHGAAVGQVDPEMIFYLNARGIGPEQARRILAMGFVNEVVGSIPEPTVQQEMMEQLQNRMQEILKNGNNGSNSAAQ